MARWTFAPRTEGGDVATGTPGGARIAAVQLALSGIKPYRDAHRKPRPDALERQGLAVLTAPAVELPKTAACYVRIWYRSEGGERLCFDAGPMTHARASALCDDHKPSPRQSWERAGGSVQYTDDNRCPSDALDAVVHTDPASAWTDGARFVVLPSQRPEPVERTEEPTDVETAITFASVRASLEAIREGLRSLVSDLQTLPT